MALDLNAPLDRLIVLLKTITGLADDTDGTAHVHKGVPPSFPTRLTAYVALADFPATNERATQLQAVTADYAVGFGYRVSGDEGAAETAMCAAALAFLLLMKQAVNRTLDPGTGALVNNAELLSQGSSRPQYILVASQETRLIEVLVRTTQQQTY